ncbi:XK-related protein 4 [Tribolium castaneum]|uniref:XK-related protein n=1 Tax=Tribolium castaneum TaxID=7070 RepID=D6WAQ5_TRICA|nr:PREDICTED: XK-related protein 4 [Tribolium castaneum]EEZ98912.2 hypothetical protein TcasGA2_TC004531 [Tribolium castaneum]|eukprot:XP_008200858.1 PREDICTED: XK-related protein 4 [Tribolium castaneum]
MVNYNFNKTLSTERLVHQTDENYKVSFFKMFKSLIVTLLLGGNIIYVQYLLFYHDEINWSYPEPAYLTTLVIYFLSAAINMCFSIRIHKMSENSNDSCNFVTKLIVTGVLIAVHIYFSVFMHANLQKSETNSSGFDKVVTIFVAVIFLFLQITSFLNHVSVAQYAVQCRFASSDSKRIKFFKQMVEAEADADLISTLDCYLRAAPQLIVQFAAIVHNKWSFDQIPVLQIFFIFIAFAITPWSITSFNGSLRKQQRCEIRWKAKIIYYLWHFFVMGSRIAGVGAVAAFWPSQTKILTVIHWTLMTTWLLTTVKPTHFSNFNNFWHFLFCSVFGAVYFFNPVNLGNQPTRAKYLCFYLIMFVENVVANVGWFVADNEVTPVWKIAFVAFNQFLFVFGIGFMVTYYVKFHPSNTQKGAPQNVEPLQETAV